MCRPTPDEAAQWREGLDRVLNNNCRCTSSALFLYTNSDYLNCIHHIYFISSVNLRSVNQKQRVLHLPWLVGDREDRSEQQKAANNTQAGWLSWQLHTSWRKVMVSRRGRCHPQTAVTSPLGDNTNNNRQEWTVAEEDTWLPWGLGPV